MTFGVFFALLPCADAGSSDPLADRGGECGGQPGSLLLGGPLLLQIILLNRGWLMSQAHMDFIDGIVSRASFWVIQEIQLLTNQYISL